MTRLLSLLLAGVLLFPPALRAESDKEVEAHKAVLDLSGAFTNDGFKIRDGHWSGALKSGEHVLVAVNLYAGNQYWFAVASVEPAKKVEVAVYDEAGKLVTTEGYSEGERAAAGFSPANSGQYYISVGLLEGGESSFCLVYCYK
ncbi:MAG TPA: hypothetical protein VGG94_02570 [Chthoniobacterales bacterium]|jgi:hypothetical protein